MSPKNKRAEPLRDPPVPDCRIRRSGSIDDELRRIARAEIDFALAYTRCADRKPARAVHQCRKAIKRLRALVRLGRGADKPGACRIDRRLRNTGRLLAAARDAEVVHRTATDLTTSDAHSNPIRIEPRTAEAIPDADVLRQVRKRLGEAAPEVDEYFAGARSRESLSASIGKACRKVVRLMERFRERPTQGRAHDWRKGVQRYANQLAVMADLWPERADAELDLLDKLAKCLGEYNDLTILRSSLEHGHVGVDAGSRSALLDLARKRQHSLRERALDLGESLTRARATPPSAMRVERERRWL